jgi:hypothetical protein
LANAQLLNGPLEGPYSRRDADEVVIAHEWEPWFDNAKTRPEFKEETRDIGRGRVHTGASAQKWFTLHAVHNAGIWQRVNAVVDQWYLLCAWIYMWSSEGDDPDVSHNPGKMHPSVGINPWGHWPMHPATVWGKELGQDQYNQWTQVQVLAQAWHSEISICVRNWNEWKAKHNDIYLDDITLQPEQVAIGDPSPPPPPPGGSIDYDLIATMTSIRTVNLLGQALKVPE